MQIMAKLSFNITKLNWNKNNDECIFCNKKRYNYNYHLSFKCQETKHYHTNDIDVIINTNYDNNNI